MTFREGVFCFFRGFAMGLADLVPGVSGGTVAMLAGIYKRWLYAVGSLKARHFFLMLALLVPWKPYRSYWQCLQKEIDFLFLLLLLGGILSAVFSMSHGIHYLLQAFPFFMRSLFFVLILVGLIQVFVSMTWNLKTCLGFLVSVGLSFYFFSQFKASAGAGFGAGVSAWSEVEIGLPYVCAGGFLAIGAMLLPGISGSYVLLLMGTYERVLEMLKNFEWAWLFPFGFSVGLGFLFFSRCIKWLLKKQPLATLSILLGLMTGSLYVLWPWN